MVHITNIGGSLTTAVCLSLIAWSIRVLRAAKLADQKSRARVYRENTGLPSMRLINSRRTPARLSPAAFWMLVESRCLRPVLVDVRSARELADTHPEDDGISKRLEMVRIPIEELAHVLRNKATQWRLRARDGPHAKPPSLRDTMVFISTHGNSATQAAAIAMALGYQRVMAIDGGLAAAAPLAPPSSSSTPTHSSLHNGLVTSESNVNVHDGSGARGRVGSPRNGSDSPFASSSPRTPSSSSALSFVPPGETLSRDALLLLMEYGQAQGAPLVTLVDTRRHDERALYGSIRGSVHLAAEQLPRALLMSPDDFLRAHHFRKPGPDDVVVVHSRRQERASYAKQLLGDAGLHRCLVLSEGVMGWRSGGGGGEDVRAYDAFAEGEAPPEPYPAEPPVDIDRPEAEAELMHKNVLLP